MKILIIGDYPLFHGGVTNYTRPLAEELSKKHDVIYLYNSTRTGNNTFKYGTKILSRKLKDVTFASFELVNGKANYLNYNNLYCDVSDWPIKYILNFIGKVKPDTIHINEIFGFSSSVIKHLKSAGAKVFVTVHEYWWLCPHRVMVDFNKKICEGPFDIQKCAFCVSKKQTNKSDSYVKFIAKLKHDFPFLFSLGMNAKKIIKQKNTETESSSFENLKFGNLNYKDYKNQELENQLKKRLDANIEALNSCDKVIAVSSDVKNILTRYGVKPEKILVQHIGSTIAERSIPHTKKLDSKEIVFGFIGGVGYYKGVHQLVEAFTKLPEELKSKAKLKIFGKYSQGYYNSIKLDFIKNQDQERIKFYGRFTPDDIPQITNQIDISVLPSLCADTAPQTIFESFSCGLPIIAPDVGGFPDFITHELNGLIYEAASVEGLKKALESIIKDPKKINHFQNNIPKSKTLDENVSELIVLYSAT
jgi:glycosyltransferase involved in cell wall biosynthesis